ncbi:hypothetical protein NDU88_004033 [Pleurodeles waltl]|uniref:Uncharacterized protein n=1 Tax=Pleurodeles waltl TaxID=8319 RepID=A0AAV7T6Y2_PLEWA|nr:hypothetical protein NDU88_004033 [Pleurodeles waltl]
MEDRGSIQQIDLQEILKGAREVASTHSKEWILRQIREERAGKRPSEEAPNDEGHSETTRSNVFFPTDVNHHIYTTGGVRINERIDIKFAVTKDTSDRSNF